MGQGLLLPYQFVTFVVGIACLSAIATAARRDRHGLARPFLVLYSALSLFVMAALLPSILPGARPGAGTLSFVVEYLESVVGRYAVMFSLTLFVHRLFGVDRRRDRVMLWITLVTAGLQHLTEFGLDGRWDDRGDVFEDVVFAGVICYTLWVGFSNRKNLGAQHPLATRFFWISVLALPGLAYDLFLRADGAWRFYPLWYSVSSVVMTVTLVRPSPAGTAAALWGLSGREQEVVDLLRRGLSNKAIARELEISPNTVKTHLRSVFDKSGIRTRLGLMAALSATDDSNDP